MKSEPGVYMPDIYNLQVLKTVVHIRMHHGFLLAGERNKEMKNLTGFSLGIILL